MLEYIQSSFRELKDNVTWPTYSELQNSTIVVAIAAMIFALIVYGMDKGVYFVLKPFLGVIEQ
jgi:preprotein translocase subunit SecE